MGFCLTDVDERVEKKNPITRARRGMRNPDGWNIIAETSTAGYTNFYTWGIDASGTLGGAAGVGGLLSMTRVTGSTTNTYFYCADGNCNITDMVSVNGNVVAHYEYSPFGETLVATGPMAAANPWRFSTRYYDTETGLIMYPARPYSPTLGRFLSRDPLGEEVFLQARIKGMRREDRQRITRQSQEPSYLFVHNAPTVLIDPQGLHEISGCECCPEASQAADMVDAAILKGTCRKWFEDHGHDFSGGGMGFTDWIPGYSITCHSNWKIPCLLGFPTWTFPGFGIGVCTSKCKEYGSAGLASLLIHEIAHHYCPLTIGREECAMSAQDACASALTQ